VKFCSRGSFAARLLILAALMLPRSVCAAAPEEVTFASNGFELHGFIYRPEGQGPFPAVLYNHGSERRPGSKPEVAAVFNAKGYVVFVPHRRGHGRSSGPYIMDQLGTGPSRGSRMVELLEEQGGDVVAALAYLRQLTYVDSARIAVAGCSFGGIQTMLAAERASGLRAAVAFAAGAMTWNSTPEIRERLIRAAQKSTVPIFLLQAENDYSVAPSLSLASELERAGKPYKMQIFPAYGTTHQDGHGGFCVRGGASWGAAVLEFLDANLSAK